MKKVITNKIAEKLDRKIKESALKEKAIFSARLMNNILAIGALIGGAIILGICVHYLSSMAGAYQNGQLVGSFVWKQSVLNIYWGIVGGGCLGTLGLLELINLIANRSIKKVQITVQPTNISENL